MRSVPAPALPRRVLADPLLAPILAGGLLALIEGVAIGARLPLIAALVGVFVASGAIVGGVQLGTEALVRRFGLNQHGAALLCALPSLAIWIPVAATLFEGAKAATMTGASAAPYVLPPVLYLGTAIAARIALWWRGAIGRWADPILAAALTLLLALLWFANHHLFRSGYPDLHTGLTICEIVVGGLALRCAAPGGAPTLAGVTRGAIAAAAAAAFVAALLFGLAPEEDRRRVQNHGDDTRHLVGLWRGLIDLDGDGTSAVLGGGDCDDRDDTRHPGARDVPGNRIDEDCDGFDPEPLAPSPEAEAQARSVAEWRARPEVAAELARLAPMNVLVLSVDAMRGDLLDPDAASRTDFPHLTGLLDGAVWFQRAQAPAAGTDISLTTFVTGRWNPFQKLDTTLIEAMHDSGRFTGAIFPREVLRYVPEPLLTRGNEEVVRLVTDAAKRDVGDTLTAETTTDRAIALLDQAGGEPFFVWAHYFDAHEHKQIDPPAALLGQVQPGRNTTEHRYRALLRGIDTAVGRLLGELTTRGLADRTIVVLYSDHGESLGEDPRLPDNHGLVVYQAMVHVPIAFKLPGVAARAELEPVSLVDLAPTLLGLIGAPTAIATLDGVDLLPNLLGAPEPLRAHGRALVMNESDQWAVLEWPWKLLVRPKENLTELYRLDEDPLETRDLAASEPDRVRALRGRYGQFPSVPMDRKKAGRRWREEQARPPAGRGR